VYEKEYDDKMSEAEIEAEVVLGEVDGIEEWYQSPNVSAKSCHNRIYQLATSAVTVLTHIISKWLHNIDDVER